MRICFVGKYPPIEGGVSAQTYWAVRGLAERGHQVFVVTNASEVEEAFRIHLEPQDDSFLAPGFPNGGAVRVFSPEPYGPRMSHIPRSDAFVSKLAGMALRVVEGFDCEVIIGSYFEPYGLAAWLAAQWSGTRLLLEHAGSDLDRLMRLPDLAAAYKHMLRSASGVITGSSLATRFLGMGVSAEALFMSAPYGVPAMFAPQTPPLPAGEIERLALVRPPGTRAFDPALPVVGMYGKPGKVKGTYDLIAALGMLRESGLDFSLLLLSGVSQQGQLTEALARSGLDDRTWVLPFLPHWRVASFIRACTAVCFLERDFSVAIHGPAVAREVLACGTCLVLSGEIHRKQRNRDQLIDGESVVLVPDPKDRDILAKQLRSVIEQPETAAGTGARGRLTLAEFPGFDGFVDAWEAIVAGRPAGFGHGTGPAAERIDAILPWARPLLGDALDQLVTEFARDHSGLAGDTDPVLADHFCAYVAGRIPPVAGEVARYQRARLWAMRDEASDTTRRPAPPVVNALGNRDPGSADLGALYPYWAVPFRIERFDHDVTPALCHTGGSDVLDASALAQRAVVVCFARLPNLATAELRLSDASVRLLERCSGGTRADALVADLIADMAPANPPAPIERQGIEQQAFAALGGLYRAGVIGFSATAVPVAAGA